MYFLECDCIFEHDFTGLVQLSTWLNCGFNYFKVKLQCGFAWLLCSFVLNSPTTLLLLQVNVYILKQYSKPLTS
ncbi:hypothetical protein RIF29_25953 [Crotalaria pallida]|uniref:Uncharacterized protein n=1 Tax=Crotalaria pallida TaxID=3830 RepID=A0AAN9EN33_CROPI